MEWARNYARMKSIKEERIVKIAFIQIRKSFMNRFSLVVSIISVSIATILLLDYAILESEKSSCFIKNRTFDGTNNMLELVVQTSSSENLNIRLDQMDPNYHNLKLDSKFIFIQLLY